MISEQQMQMLADIFRIILKEINSDEDKEKLAPGELGISYNEGAFYVRDPHTGELFCPNSLTNIKQILNNYDPNTGKLNADSVNHIRFYTSVSQLPQIGITMDADTVIRQMAVPSVLFAPIAYENYETLNFPSEMGLLTVIKVNEAYVQATFSDLVHNVMYDGIYDANRHLFDGWLSRGTNTSGSDIGETTTGGTTINVTYGKPVTDLSIITIRVTEEILPGAKISVDGTTALPIVDHTGQPLAEAIPANTIIMLAYDDHKKVWIYCNPAVTDVQTIVNQILGSRITSVAVVPEKSGYLYTVQDPNATTIAINGFDNSTDDLVVNYGQTILRPGIDYVFVTGQKNVIQIINDIQFVAGDQLYFAITKFKTVTV